MSCESAQMRCEGKIMPDAGTVEAMQSLVREIAEMEDPDNAKSAIARAARAMGIGDRRAFGFYYGTARSVSAAEWIAAQQAAMDARRKRARRLRSELEALEKLLGEQDAEDSDGRSQGTRVCG